MLDSYTMHAICTFIFYFLIFGPSANAFSGKYDEIYRIMYIVLNFRNEKPFSISLFFPPSPCFSVFFFMF